MVCNAASKDKRVSRHNLLTLVITGRRGGIRTRDPLHPMQVRYQAALHAEAVNYSSISTSNREQGTDFLQFLMQCRTLFKHKALLTGRQADRRRRNHAIGHVLNG